MLPGLGPNRQPSISLKFLLEAGLELESFEPLIDFLEFLVQKLWYKLNKLTNKSNIFIIFDHNFWTRNLSRSSKVSKDSDCGLVSNKNFSKILPSSGLGPGPGEVVQGALNVYLWCHSQKILTSNQKIFVHFATHVVIS